MASLDNVVSAMSTELNNSTLGWDVVVNYSANDLNKVLKTAFDARQEGQIYHLHVELRAWSLEDGDVIVKYYFDLGTPVITFEPSSSLTASCQLDIPITGGEVTTSRSIIGQDIPGGRYSLRLSGVALVSVEGTLSNYRNPRPSDQPFLFYYPNMTAVVSLDIKTSASMNRLQAEIIVHDIGPGLPLIDTQVAALGKCIVKYFQQAESPIYWDLAHVTNHSKTPESTILVPKKFQFACYAPDNVQDTYTILSIFIHLLNTEQSGTQDNLQEKWSVQWGRPDFQFPLSYGVPPIPDTYTASIIFNHQLITALVEKKVQQQGMRIEQIQKTSSDTFAIKWKIHTGIVYERPRYHRVSDNYPYSEFDVDGASVNLDRLSEPEGLLYLSIGQNGGRTAGASLQWHFSYNTAWEWVNGSNGALYTGTLVATSSLDQTTGFDNSALADYQVHLDIRVGKAAWVQTLKPDKAQYYNSIFSHNFDSASRNSLPDPPTFDLDLLDIDFFMTTNLLLPGSKVINFEASPGVRFPRDLYLVGHIIDNDQVKRSRSAVVE